MCLPTASLALASKYEASAACLSSSEYVPDSNLDPTGEPHEVQPLSRAGCWLVLITAALGWMCAGFQLAISSLAMRDAARSLLPGQPEEVVGAWFGRLIQPGASSVSAGSHAFAPTISSRAGFE